MISAVSKELNVYYRLLLGQNQHQFVCEVLLCYLQWSIESESLKDSFELDENDFISVGVFLNGCNTHSWLQKHPH